MSAYNLPERHTIGEFIAAVLAIDNAKEAREFFDGHVAWIQRSIDAGTWTSTYSAEAAARANLGWCFGEGMAADRIRMWVEVCGASHPVFGSMSTPPSPKQALDAGIKQACTGEGSR